MAAPPSHSAPHHTDRRPSTPLSAVFRRLSGEAPARPLPPPVVAPPPRPAAPPSPERQLLGFAEPVAEVPPIEDFLPAGADVAAPPEPEPEPEPEPPPPVQARVRELPPAPPPPAAPPPPPAPEPPSRPHNLVGRLGRRLGDAPGSAAASSPATHPASARHLAEPPPEPPHSPGERAGRPSLPRNRRAYRRVKLPAEIEIGGVPCTLIDVSIGGFAASNVPQIEPNALVPVTIRLIIDGIEVGTQLSARIVYVTKGRSAGRFIDLSPAQMAFLRYIVTWRGESVGAVGTTTLLDAIAGGADRGFPPGSGDRADPEAKSRWWAGLIGKKVNPPR